MFKKRSILLLILSLNLISYCASFRENNISMVKDSDYKANKAEKIKVFRKWKYQSNGPDAIPRADFHKSWFDKAMVDSGCCIIVEKPTEATLVVDGIAANHIHPMRDFFNLLSVATATVLPYWATTNVDIQVTVMKGNKKHEYKLKDSFTMVQWLPMIFVFPFTGTPIKNRDELYLNTYQELVVQMKKDGVI
ncbi:hypothetical protein LPTSP2_28060 [Leptospira ellinghausenii]|uniref:Lipoprotein n=1 Tax=Leptospira ellinghausenii TaxID=1917822 RepID=A0A2P2DFU9_9LEPT|nr:hypothetical protein [Leptospira ellinghausenii]GBF43505.1 hypothetical protein LPTSP2_28060 [Leptospira ellinghausenii]